MLLFHSNLFPQQMSLRYFINSLAYSRLTLFRTHTNSTIRMASNHQTGVGNTTSPCQCPTDEDTHSALLSENEKREKRIHSLLTEALTPSSIRIEDVSGGCGAMFKISVCSDQFRGKKMLEQHRMVNTILKEEIKSIHAITLDTSVPK